MGDALNNFMTGKKKYSASVILPIIVAVINVFVTNTETANTLVELVQEFLPTIIALVGGAVFTVVEGVNDNSKIKASTAATASTNGTVASQTVTASQPAQAAQQTAAIVVLEAAPYAWDVQAFDEQVKKKVTATYGVQNPSTELYQAMNSGVETQCEYIEHSVQYWDYLTMKADARFSDVWGYSFREATEKVQEPGCPTHPSTCGSFSNLKHKALALGESYYTSYLDYERIRQKSIDVISLAEYVKKGFNWKTALPVTHHTLYWLGEDAAQLLKFFS